MLNIANIEHKMFETTSSTYVDDWINSYSTSNFNFTDIICVGGDGLFSQLINAIGDHNDRSDLIKIPIGLLPCGSQNAIACDLGGRDVFNSWVNIIRGTTVSSDIMWVQFKDLNRIVYATSLLWGITGDIVSAAENWRGCFGSARYWIWGARMFLCSCKLKDYRCKIEYKNNQDAVGEWSSVYMPFDDDKEEQKEYVGSMGRLEKEATDDNILAKSQNVSLNQSYSFEDIPQTGWKPYHTSHFLFFCVLTHEARNSLHKEEIFMPHARFNDSKMYIGTVERMNKLNTLRFLKQFSSAEHTVQSKHGVNSSNNITMTPFNDREVTEVKINPQMNSCFNIDGEIYPNDEVYVRLLPSYLNLIGKVFE